MYKLSLAPRKLHYSGNEEGVDVSHRQIGRLVATFTAPSIMSTALSQLPTLSVVTHDTRHFDMIIFPPKFGVFEQLFFASRRVSTFIISKARASNFMRNKFYLRLQGKMREWIPWKKKPKRRLLRTSNYTPCQVGVYNKSAELAWNE